MYKKNHKLKILSNHDGMTLLEILIAFPILTFVLFSLLQTFKFTYDNLTAIEQVDSRTLIQLNAYNKLDCITTLLEAIKQVDPTKTKFDPQVCPATTQDPNSLDINPILLYRTSSLGKKMPLTGPLISSGPLKGAARFGDWYLKAGCSAQDNTIVVRAAKATSNGQFIKDPISGESLDFNHKLALIFGSGSGKAISSCYFPPTFKTEIASAEYVLSYVPGSCSDFSPNSCTPIGKINRIKGPANAFLEVINFPHPDYPGRWDDGDGIQCNPDQGWALLQCTYTSNTDISPDTFHKIIKHHVDLSKGPDWFYPFYTVFHPDTGAFDGIPGQYPSRYQALMDRDTSTIPFKAPTKLGCITNDRDQANAIGGHYVASPFRNKDADLIATPIPRPILPGEMVGNSFPDWQGQPEIKLAISCYRKSP